MGVRLEIKGEIYNHTDAISTWRLYKVTWYGYKIQLLEHFDLDEIKKRINEIRAKEHEISLKRGSMKHYKRELKKLVERDHYVTD